MARVARSRSRTNSVTSTGSLKRYIGAVFVDDTPYGPFSLTETNSDFHGSPWSDSTFIHFRLSHPHTSLSGSRVQGGVTYITTNSPLWGAVGPFLNSLATQDAVIMPGAYSTAQLGQMAIANANPNRPVIDLPVSIVELRELPELLRDTGRVLLNLPKNLKHAAKANLAAQFGWGPLISDLKDSLNFVQQVDAREKYLRKLNSSKPVRIHRKIGEQKWQYSSIKIPFNTTSENSSQNTSTVKILITNTNWYSVRARLTVSLSEREIQSNAFDAVLGLTHGGIHAAQIWELLPWSWLIDWFTTTGSILAAYRGGLPFSYEGLNLMTRTDYEIHIVFHNGIRNGFTVTHSNPQGKAVRQKRTPVASIWNIPEFRLPYLSASQYSILASLATLRL